MVVTCFGLNVFPFLVVLVLLGCLFFVCLFVCSFVFGLSIRFALFDCFCFCLVAGIFVWLYAFLFGRSFSFACLRFV